jgi:murein DD-endopeptidase MepM/ murein hydrolase activator NlpD
MRNPLDHMRIRRQLVNHTFGMVRNRGTRPHQGWDLAAPEGTPVFAIANGRIRDARDEGDYGMQLVLEFMHKGRTLYAFYAHLSGVLVAEGGAVYEGQLLGFTGRTGNASNLAVAEDHLHFEIREGAIRPGRGLVNRLDPGEVLGYEIYSSQP